MPLWKMRFRHGEKEEQEEKKKKNKKKKTPLSARQDGYCSREEAIIAQTPSDTGLTAKTPPPSRRTKRSVVGTCASSEQ